MNEEKNKASYDGEESVYEYSKLYLRVSEKRVLDSYLSNNKDRSVLIVGCGAGRVSHFVSEKVDKVISFDISKPLIDRAKKLYPDLKFFVMDACNIEFPNETFDIVYFPAQGLDCIYPLENRNRALKEMKRVMKSDGLLIYTSHNSINIARTRSGIEILINNLTRLKIGPHYRTEKHPYGEFDVYYNNPFNEIVSTSGMGLEIETCFGNYSLHIPKIIRCFLEKHVTYIFKKINNW